MCLQGRGPWGPWGVDWGGIFSLKGYKPHLVLKSYRLSTFHSLGRLLASRKNNMKPQQGFRGALEVGMPPSWLQIPPCRRSLGTASHQDPPAGWGQGGAVQPVRWQWPSDYPPGGIGGCGEDSGF